VIVGLIPKIAGMEAAEEVRGPWRPRASAAGVDRCVRADVYHAAGAKPAPLPGRAALVFDDGEWAEELTLDWLRKTVYRVHSAQMPVDCVHVPGLHAGYSCGRKGCGRTVAPGEVHGHIDAILTDPVTGKDLLLEHKAYNPFTWQRWATGKEVPWDIVIQAALYVHGVRRAGGNPDGALVVVKNKATAAFLELSIGVPDAFDGDIAVLAGCFTEGEQETPIPGLPVTAPRLLARSVERLLQIRDAAAAKVLPPRPFDLSDWRCSYCAFASTCWENYQGEVAKSTGNVAVFRDPADVELVLKAMNAVQALKVAEAEAKSTKSAVAARMRALGARAGVLHPNGLMPIDVRLDLRKRESVDPDLLPPDVRAAATVKTEYETVTVRPRRAREEE
jgi:hypothetical protein